MAEPAEPRAAASPVDSFVDHVKQALEIVQLRLEAIDAASRDEAAFTMGLVVVALAGVAAAIGSLNIFGIIALPIFYLVGAFVGAGILHLIATLAFKGQGEFLQFFRPLSLAYVLLWVNVVPFIGPTILGLVASLWLMVVAVIIVEQVYALERPKAIATVVIPVVALFLLILIFGAFLFSMLVILGMSGAS